MKKMVSLLIVMSLILSVAACAGGTEGKGDGTKESNQEGQTAESTGEETEFEIWISTGDLETDTFYTWLVDLADAYNEKHPEVAIKLTCIGTDALDYEAKWKLAAANDNMPDVISCGSSYLKDWAEAGVIVDMAEELGADEEFMNRFSEGAMEFVHQFCPEGTVYGVPWRNETFGWMYNTELFEQCNLEIPKTWDDLMNCIEVFNQNDIVPIAHGGTDNWEI